MKTNMIQVFTITVGIGLIAGLVGLEVTGNILTGGAIGISYFTVAALMAMAIADYRPGPKAYYASSVVTGHFQPADSASIALRTPSEKVRIAA